MTDKLICRSTGNEMYWRENAWDDKSDNKWNWPWQPRKCSQCGGIHPEDLDKLLDEQWEVEFTGKIYKVYLNPPGTSFSRKRFMQQVESNNKKGLGLGSGDEGFPSVSDNRWTPTPPTKVYAWHLGKEQLDKLNKAYRYVSPANL